MSMLRACVPAMFGRNWWESFDYSPSILDQHFGTILSDSDLLPPRLYRGYLLRPRTQAAEQQSGQSKVKNEKDKFQIKLDVSQFKRNEIKVKVVDNYIVIHGEHEEMSDDHGSIQRKFTRRYMLPVGAEPESVKSSMGENGILIIEAVKKPIEDSPSNERVVPVLFGLPELSVSHGGTGA